jgi:amphi-Trp domain-containing protein
MEKPARMKHPKSRDIEKHYTAAQFAEKLRRLADAIEARRAFTIEVAGERLRVPTRATFNVEHERQGASEELEFQLQWKRGTGDRA